jgi:4'-phosphopantetheinyl transferase
VLELPAGEAHVWWLEPTAALRAQRDLLTEEEIARMERFHFERDRDLFLATRLLVRTTLSRYQEVAPADWRFTANSHGRPEISFPGSALRFNLSNTLGLVVCAVARSREVGIDVERIARRAPLDVADRYFAADEVAALRALPPGEQERRFFDYWTLKESYIKARGLGLALPLEQFAFFLGSAEPRLVVDPTLGDDGGRWHFVQRLVTNEHLLALCVERLHAEERPVIRWQSP